MRRAVLLLVLLPAQWVVLSMGGGKVLLLLSVKQSCWLLWSIALWPVLLSSLLRLVHVCKSVLLLLVVKAIL